MARVYRSMRERMSALKEWKLWIKRGEGYYRPFDSSEIWDLTYDQYAKFLDTVTTLRDFILGLTLLSPLANDALEVARYMDDRDFFDFKIALAYERRSKSFTKMPDRYTCIMLPGRIIDVVAMANEMNVDMGVAWYRIAQYEEGITVEEDVKPDRF